MNPYTVVIPSAKMANVVSCVAAVRRHQPDAPIIVVADGIAEDARKAVSGVTWLEGIKPFCYARNVNLGIVAAGTNDVILLNDDAWLANPRGFDNLRTATNAFGIVSSLVNGRCCNTRQRSGAVKATTITEPGFLAFVCVYIPRTTIDKIGLLDERFEGGTWEDNDYCRRVTTAGMWLGICGQCLVEHRFEHTTFEKKQNYRQILDENRKRYEAKWAKTQTLLSVCVCSIFSRKNYLERLLACLAPQWTERVEFLLAADDGQKSIGAKRQRLLQQASGDYIVFIDDDDLVAPDFLSKILTAILRNPSADAVTYRSKRYCDGVFEADCIYSIENKTNTDFTYIDGIKTYLRFPYHVTPIKRDLALKIGFQELDFLEDTKFAEAIRPLIKTEEHINEVLYHYWWRSNRAGEVTHKTIVGR